MCMGLLFLGLGLGGERGGGVGGVLAGAALSPTGCVWLCCMCVFAMFESPVCVSWGGEGCGVCVGAKLSRVVLVNREP